MWHFDGWGSLAWGRVEAALYSHLSCARTIHKHSLPLLYSPSQHQLQHLPSPSLAFLPPALSKRRESKALPFLRPMTYDPPFMSELTTFIFPIVLPVLSVQSSSTRSPTRLSTICASHTAPTMPVSTVPPPSAAVHLTPPTRPSSASLHAVPHIQLDRPSMTSSQPASQLAWLSTLKTGFNDFTPDMKFLRKVSNELFVKDRPEEADVHHRHHWPEDQHRGHAPRAHGGGAEHWSVQSPVSLSAR